MSLRSDKGLLYPRNAVQAYCMAAAAVLGAYSLFLLVPALAVTPLASFILAVAAVAAYLGYGPALFAAALSTAAACGLIMPLLWTLPGVLWTLGVFLTVALSVAGLSATRQKAEFARRAAEESLRHWKTVMEASGDAILSMDLDGTITAWSKGAAALFGYTMEEAIGMSVARLAPEDRVEEIERFLAALRRGHCISSIETERLSRDGRRIGVSVTSLPILGAGGKPVGASAMYHDITARKNAEEALRESEARFRAFQETSLDGFVAFRAVREDGRIVDFEFTYANPTAERIVGMGALAGKRLLKILPAHGGSNGIFERYVRVVETGEPHDMEFLYEGEGIRAWFRNMSVKLDDGLAMAFMDITARKRAEEALLESEARHRTIVENLAEGLVASDLEGNLFHWNRAALKLHGFESLDECRRKLPEFTRIFELTELDGTPVPIDRWPLARLLRDEQLHGWELRVRRLNSDWERVYSYGGTLVPDGDGRPLMAVLTITDVTDRKRAEKELQALAHTLERRVAERTTELERTYETLRQSERLATLGQAMTVLSHENRNAVQNCQAALQMLKRIVEDPRQARYVELALTAVNGLQHDYEDIRQYAAPMKLNRTRVSLAGLWRESWAELESRRTGRDARLHEALDCIEVECEVDAPRIKQAFRNIIENSLDACPDPVEITVDCDRTELNGQPALRVSLRDNGPRGNEADPDRLMEAFYTTKGKGTGLGLAVVRRIVEAHGGRAQARPAQEKGFEVEIVLPAKAA